MPSGYLKKRPVEQLKYSDFKMFTRAEKSEVGSSFYTG